jgi:hypothetical protein
MMRLTTFLMGALLAAPLVVEAQTDYYNTDAGRPIQTEDAHPVEYRAVELQFAPLRMERAPGGVYTWGIEPHLAIGILPNTHLEAGIPLAFVDRAGRRTAAAAGAEVSLFHNLNVETSIPALALAADVLVPLGGFGPDKVYPSVKGIATKTFTGIRAHVNGRYTFGDEPSGGGEVVHLSRWMAGLALDKTLPLRSLLMTGEVVAEQPIHGADELEWSAAGGVRYQLSPRLAVDAGLGARISGSARPWYVTFGSAYAFGLPWNPGTR